LLSTLSDAALPGALSGPTFILNEDARLSGCAVGSAVGSAHRQTLPHRAGVPAVMQRAALQGRV